MKTLEKQMNELGELVEELTTKKRELDNLINQVRGKYDLTKLKVSERVIMDIVCNYFAIPEDEFLSKTRTNELKNARFWYYYLCRNRLNTSLVALARATNRTHASVINGIKAKEFEIGAYPEDKRDKLELEKLIDSYYFKIE
jgi:chromosomal replication initiation ATPase DnaA